MIPIRDTVRSYSFPVVNWLLIGLNLLVFLYEAMLSPARLNHLIATYGLIPAHLHLNDAQWILTHPLVLATIFTSMFLHGGWFHVISNIWFLYIFGDNVEDRMGSIRYLFFYLASGLVAGLAQAFVLSDSQLPNIGASGAIAGVLGAYLLMFPKGRVVTLILFFILPWFIEIPAIFYLGLWFVTQIVSGISLLNLPDAINAGGVAWWAHIGGFVFGLVFYRFFYSPVPPGGDTPAPGRISFLVIWQMIRAGSHGFFIILSRNGNEFMD
jgi:membrane associated rhomboid family serine protease